MHKGHEVALNFRGNFKVNKRRSMNNHWVYDLLLLCLLISN